MKKILIASSLLLALSGFAASASAADLSTSYVEAAYSSMDSDYSGYNLKGSIGFGSTGVYGLVDHTSNSVESLDLEQTTIGLGYQFNVAGNVALFAEGGYYRIDVAGFDANGYTASFGTRIAAGEYVEPFAKVTYNDVSDIGNATNFTVGALIKPWEHVGFVGQYTLGGGDEVDQWKAGVRYTF